MRLLLQVERETPPEQSQDGHPVLVARRSRLERESMHTTYVLACRSSGLVAILVASAIAAAQPAPRPAQPVDSFSGHPRVVIISDIGNEPDDQMSFVRLLLYSNEFDVEAMIA